MIMERERLSTLTTDNNFDADEVNNGEPDDNGEDVLKMEAELVAMANGES